MLILLDDGKTLTVGPEETHKHTFFNIKFKAFFKEIPGPRPNTAQFETREPTAGLTNIKLKYCTGSSLDSLAGVVRGVLRTVSGAVAAEETGSVFRRYRRVLARPPSLGFHPRALQDVVRVLTCSWTDEQKQIQYVV